MEEINIDGFRLLLWGPQDDHQNKLLEAFEAANLKTISAPTGNDWVKGVENKVADIGIIIVTQDNFFFALNYAQSVRKINKDIPLFAFATEENSHFLTEMEEQGFNDHFFLPINIDHFLTKLGRHFPRMIFLNAFMIWWKFHWPKDQLKLRLTAILLL